MHKQPWAVSAPVNCTHACISVCRTPKYMLSVNTQKKTYGCACRHMVYTHTHTNKHSGSLRVCVCACLLVCLPAACNVQFSQPLHASMQTNKGRYVSAQRYKCKSCNSKALFCGRFQVISKDIDHLYMSGDEEERKSIQQTSQMFAAQITQLLFKVPRVLLLLLKTNDCLRSVDLALGEVFTLVTHLHI